MKRVNHKEILLNCKDRLQENPKDLKLINECLQDIKKFTPANFIQIVKVSFEDNRVILEFNNQKRVIDTKKTKNSILLEAINNKQALIANNLITSFVYNPKIDNLIDKDIKDLMIVPIIDTEQNNLLFILWIATSHENIYQFIQDDLDKVREEISILTELFKDLSSNSEIKKLKNIIKEYKKKEERHKELSNKKDLYFSSIIHDIRTPMNAIIGFLDILLLKEDDETKKEYIQSALKSSENMITLINDALDLSKLASGKMNIEKIEFAPFQELSDSAKIFANSAIKKDICFSAYIDPTIPKKIISDPLRIKQIINNLLSNALKFTPPKGSITLEIIYDEKIDGMTISVTDTGKGISKERQKKIFSPYEQEDNSTAREYGGTGLGLSISMQLAILLGGKLELESQEGKGSKFYFTIPCNTPPLTPISYEANSIVLNKFAILNRGECKNLINSTKEYIEYLAEDSIEIDSLDNIKSVSFDTLVVYANEAINHKSLIEELIDKDKKIIVIGCDNIKDRCIFDKNTTKLTSPILPENIFKAIDKLYSKDKDTTKSTIKSNKDKLKGKIALCVDDDILNIDFMKEILKLLGIEAILASNGKQAIEIYKDKYSLIDIIFMDKNMDNYSAGIEATKNIREFENSNHITPVKIVGLTGESRAELIKPFKEAGIDVVLTKPIRINELIDTITQLI